MKKSSGVESSQGFALMMVIVILMLVSFLASQLILQVRTELRMAANTNFRSTGRMLAESGVNLALFHLLDKPRQENVSEEGAEEPPFLLGRPYETVLPTGKIEYYAVCETGKINLNTNLSGLLQMFLEYQGLEPDEVAVVIDSLADWRDGDSLYRLQGAEQDYYESLDPPYAPHNNNVEDAGEFFLIKGTEKLRGRFDPYEVFGVSAGGGKVNFNSLTPAMVDFLVEDDEVKRSLYWEMKNSGIEFTSGQAQEILGPERYALLGPYLDYKVKNNQFSIVATGYANKDGLPVDAEATDGGAVYNPGVVVRVLVEIGGDGFSNLTWRERYL